MLRLLYLVAVVGADSSACSGATGDAALITNGGFEGTDSQDMPRGMTTGTNYEIPGWTCKKLKGQCDECGSVDSAYANIGYDTCIIHAMPRGPFGSFQSGDGSKFLVLHGRVGVTQTVDDLKAGDEYALSFVAAERNGFGDGEVFRVIVDGKVLDKSRNVPVAFTTYQYTFTAASSGSAEIELLNVSPHVRATDGHSIFVDAISIVPTVDCGEGATCHTAIDGSGYTCKCNGRGYVGHDATNEKAECVDVTTLGGDDAVVKEKVDVLQEEMIAVEDGVKRLAEDDAGIKSSVELASADILALQTFQTATENATKQSDEVAKATQDDVESLKTQLADANTKIQKLTDSVNTLMASNTDLVTALTGAKASVPAVGTEPEPDDTFAPEIIGQAGGINLKLQQGRHASVNGEMLLTADEVSSLIKAAIEDALGSVGAAIE